MKNLCLQWLRWTALSVLALAVIQMLRLAAISFQKEELESRAVQKFSQTIMSFRVLNFERGDFVVEIHRPPFRARSFTHNIYTGQWIPWDLEGSYQ